MIRQSFCTAVQQPLAQARAMAGSVIDWPGHLQIPPSNAAIRRSNALPLRRLARKCAAMTEQIEDQAEAAPAPAPRARRIARRIGLVLALLVLALVAATWFSRERLADDFITGQLEKLGLDATYTIESIGPRRQVLKDIVIGDPARPDLTVERVEVTLEPRFPLIGIAGVKLEKPRLYGSYRQGKLSFGALDKLLFDQKSTEPFVLPDMNLLIDDGRALLESDYGPVGVKVAGNGNLRSGFAGILAASAPRLEHAGCTINGATIYGKASIANASPGFEGPLRLSTLDCAGQGISLGASDLELGVRLDPDLKGFEGSANLKSGAMRLAENRAGGLAGTAKFTWRKAGLTAQYDLRAHRLETPQFALRELGAEGTARTSGGMDRAELRADVEGRGLQTGRGLDTALGEAAKAASGTLLGPMLAQIRAAFAREGRDSSLSAGLTLRKTGDVLSLVMPQGRLTGGSGDTLLAVSGFQLSDGGEAGGARFSGNFATGGAELPRITGRMENRGGQGGTIMRLRMAEYRAGGGSLELPEMMIAQEPGGALGFSGSVRASGLLPGGATRGLVVPLNGNWSAANGLSLWRNCTTLRFDQLTVANLRLDARRLQLCPPSGSAIVRSDARGIRVAAGAPALDLSGSLGETPIRLKAGATGLAWPGFLAARDVDVELGAQEAPTRFRLSEINARIESDVRGSFAGAEAYLFSVPLDLTEATGEWAYSDGVLTLSGGAFRLVDREQPGRFEPLVARDATLSLVDNRIVAQALLREPRSEREVVQADIVHDLNDATGHADLTVRGLLFDGQLQPDRLTGLALGVIANAAGTVRGSGRIDWNAETVASSGSFSTDRFDFAAAFGPVRGVAGTIEFTDLLGFVTAPNQRLTIESFNPGIAVERGEVRFELRENYVIAIQGGRWPFIGGTLILEPTEIQMADADVRRFTLRLEGVDAARFVEQMDMANLVATGTFDGAVPLVFDQNGGRIENGRLLSRAPGGNVAYVGALTYEDMSPIANYVFDALKSLDYRTMEIILDGSLTGEIVTRVRFDGIRQGAEASRNIVTKQLARLPLQFNLNIHAPFYRLIGSFKAMYDPAYIRDPREVGLLDEQGNAVENPTINPPDALKPEDIPEDEAVIQPLESETVP